MGDSFDVQHKMIPVIKIFQPTVIGVGFGIKFLDIGFNTQQRCAVKDIQTGCDDLAARDAFDEHDAYAQAIRLHRRLARKDADLTVRSPGGTDRHRYFFTFLA